MKGLDPKEAADYLAILKSLRPYIKFYDTHVHPYEVLFDKFTYENVETGSRVLSLAGKSYTAPSVRGFRFPEIGYVEEDPRSRRLQDLSLLLLTKVYGNVGEQVFMDQMALSGIDQVLLLPVAAETCTAEEFGNRMCWVKEFYRDEHKFWIAGSVPSSLDGAELQPYVRALKSDFGIKALKCHPVVSGIDLSSGGRKEWLTELIAACHDTGLPLIIHGGRNNPYWGGNRGDFAAIENFKEVGISCSGTPVILAHAGLHRCRIDGSERGGLRLLNMLLDAHPNLFVDISGLTFEPLKIVLQSVPGDRILFGSDALYASQWEAVTLTMHALKDAGMSVEENLVKFASTNPKKTIFKEKANANTSLDQMESVPGGNAGEVAPGSP